MQAMDTLFFIASKLFWTLAQPSSVFLLLLALGVIQLWRGRYRSAKWLSSAALLGYCAVMFTPVAHLVLTPLETRFPVNPSVTAPGGIIVLGGSERAEQSTFWDQTLVNEGGERYLQAIALAHTYPAAKVMFSGGSGSLREGLPSESLTAERIFLQSGIAAERILLEGRSRNTAENVAFSLDLLGGAPEAPWILVTSAFHMPRAVGVFCAAGWDNIVPYPTDFRSGLPDRERRMKFYENMENLNRGTKEWIGLFVYWITGRSSALLPETCAD